ncbi:putative oxidoreductase At4g09670 [Carex rostrata]
MSEPEPEHHQNPIRFGILGCATIAHKFCRAISLLPSDTATISCISSRSLDKARQFATSARLLSSAKLLSPYDALLEDTSVDAVYVPLPTSQHVTWAVAAAAKGKHVLIEKPVALCVEELERILEACEKNGVLFMDGSMWQHHPRTAEMHRLIDDPNRIGQLRLIHTSCSFLATPEFLQNDIRVKPDLDSLGALGDLGWYCIGSILWATNYNLPRTVVASPCLSLNSSGVILSCGASLYWDNGLVATLNCSFLSHVSMDLSVHGSKGTLLVRDLTIPYREDVALFEVISGAHFAELHISWTKKPEEVVVETPLPQEALMVLEFVKEVKLVCDKKSEPSLKWADTSRKTQMVLDAVKRSIDQNFEPVYL